MILALGPCGASVLTLWLGSSITLFGEADSCNLDFWLDGVSSTGSPSNGKLGDFSGLDNREHRILMTVHPTGNGSVSFYGAQVETPIENAPL